MKDTFIFKPEEYLFCMNASQEKLNPLYRNSTPLKKAQIRQVGDAARGLYPDVVTLSYWGKNGECHVQNASDRSIIYAVVGSNYVRIDDSREDSRETREIKRTLAGKFMEILKC